MNSLSKMKSRLVELEVQKKQLGADMATTGNFFKVALGGALVGAVLSVFYGLGFILLVAGALAALFYGTKQAKNRDKMEEIDAEIQKLSTSMV